MLYTCKIIILKYVKSFLYIEINDRILNFFNILQLNNIVPQTNCDKSTVNIEESLPDNIRQLYRGKSYNI